MSELTEDERRIVSHLRDLVGNGEAYVRSHQIADAVGLTANQVGTRLGRLADKVDGIEIEKWGRSRSTTWRVSPA
ncbi:MAG: DUF7123 family protein [Halobacteriota archaeon]